MKAHALNNVPFTPFPLTSANGRQTWDLAQGFSGILGRATQAEGLGQAAGASPSPVPTAPAQHRPDPAKALVAALAAAPGPAALDAPGTPGGMANGTTASLLARGFVKSLAVPGLNRTDLPSAGAPLQPVNRVHPVAMDPGGAGNAPTPDPDRPGNGFAVTGDDRD